MGHSLLDRPHDALLRAAAFAWLRDEVDRHGGVLPRHLLAAGFTVGGQRAPLLSP